MESRQSLPDYILELEEGGYHHLSHHLQQLLNCKNSSEKNDYCDKLSFSDFARIVLATREAIFKKITSVIPVGESNVVFLIGSTGSGKSTTLQLLTGDAMQVSGHHKYESSDKQHNQVIGHSINRSQTFLPNVRLVDNTYYVDFPGFSDTLGRVICLGEDLALKALINLYNPKLFLIQTINDNARMHVFSALKIQLSQFIDQYDTVLLGLTKYIDFHSYVWYLRAKEIAKFKVVADLEIAKSHFMGRIAYLIEYKDAVVNFDEKIAAAKQELMTVNDALTVALNSPAPVSDDEIESINQVKEVERLILEALGTRRLVRLDHLKNPSVLQSCLEALSQLPKQPQTNSPYLLLSSENKATIETQFNEAVMKQLYKREGAVATVPVYASNEAFGKALLSANFLESTQPQEIVDFLRLPELNPKISEQFDRVIRQDCVKRYAEAIMRLDPRLLKHYFKHHKEAERYHELVSTLRAFIATLKFYLVFAVNDKAAEKEQMRRLYKSPCKNIDELREELTLPSWCRSFPYIKQVEPSTLIHVLADINRIRVEKDKREREERLRSMKQRESSATSFTKSVHGIFSACKKLVMGGAQDVKKSQIQVDVKSEDEVVNLSDEQIAACITELKTMQQTLNDLSYVSTNHSVASQEYLNNLDAVLELLNQDPETETFEMDSEETRTLRLSR